MRCHCIANLARFCLLVSLAIASWACAAEPAGPDDAPGIAVGEKAPPFTLPDQNGKEHTMAGMLGKGSVALVFYRSADW